MGFLSSLGKFFSSAAGGGVISSAVGALGGLLTNKQSADYNAAEAERNRQFQSDMYDKQYQQSLDFWNKQNEYNLPSAQLSRLEDAGLNPLLMYGEGGLSGNLAQQAPQLPSAPSGSQARASFNNPLDIANLGLLSAQAENLHADAELKRQNVKESQERTYGMSIQNEVSFRTRDAQVAMANGNVKKLDHEIEWLATQDFALTNMTAANLNNIASMMEYRQKYYDLDNQKVQNEFWYMVEQIAIGRAHVSNELKQIGINLFNAKTNRKRVDGELHVFDAQVKEINSRSDLNDAQKSNEYLKAYNQFLKNTMLDNIGTESLGGPAGLMLLLTGHISGRID